MSALRTERSKRAAAEKHICLQVCDGKLMLRRSHKYCSQVQGQLNISGYNKCDFIVSTGTGELFIEEIAKDTIFWDNIMIPKLREFYLKSILPEIADSRIRRGLMCREPTEVKGIDF
ncbi:hypothetical protein JTE90_002643 [Oedothorax gibbosus]|uniref:Uncharacterized protein n=1 Tax=Oedothorax gibbosus TaxID=931172 RepID=A0AAV6VH62_9ARAC|nr:hypothetical protein JTE90_002643 [Oedothorax gibbosus]